MTTYCYIAISLVAGALATAAADDQSVVRPPAPKKRKGFCRL